MMNISKSFNITSKLIRPNMINKFKNLVNQSSKLFASKKKDGATQSDKEVDKSKKTVKSSATTTESAPLASSHLTYFAATIVFSSSGIDNMATKGNLVFPSIW